TTASAPTFTAANLRRHLTKTHYEDLSDEEVIRKCKGPPLSGEDIKLIYSYDRQKTSVADRVTVKSVPKVKRATKGSNKRPASVDSEEGNVSRRQ
ncbi:hypothetical protein, partial [Escherichia coli]|uniref:hypothetical protein n=1 Tax=Escherichia coli TaxID=562 RepID=UPI003C75EA08